MGVWTDKKIEKLKILWEKGVTTAEIGKKLDFSKNAIVGKVHRLGLSNRNSPIKTSSAKMEKMDKKKVITDDSKKLSKDKKSKIKKEVSAPFVKNIDKKETLKTSVKHTKQSSSEGVSLNDLTSDLCCWPIDDVNSETFHFCGKKVFKNKPYCLEHCVMAYTTSSDKQQKENKEG